MPQKQTPNNLIPLNKRTKDERREIAQKGGIASGEARRRRKAAKETMELILALPLSNEQTATLEDIGITQQEDLNQLTLMLVSQLRNAQNGDRKSAEFVLSLIGEMPITQQPQEMQPGNEVVILELPDNSRDAEP